MRIALFSEVYWPMVSGVGVTLRNLTGALQARGHEVRVYTATYQSPDGAPTPAEVYQAPSVPLFLYPDVQWAFPRTRDLVADLARFSPDVTHVATEFAMGPLSLPCLRAAPAEPRRRAHRALDPRDRLRPVQSAPPQRRLPRMLRRRPR